MFKMKTSVRMVTDNTADLLKGIELLIKEQVLVGIPAEHADREDGGPINSAALAYLQNYGSPTQNIPARPFMEPGIKEVQAAIVANLRKAGEAALDGKPDGVLKAFHSAGTVAAGGIKTKISSDIPPPLAASTLAARKRRGRTGTRTLIDTSQMRSAITYVVREK